MNYIELNNEMQKHFTKKEKEDIIEKKGKGSFRTISSSNIPNDNTITEKKNKNNSEKKHLSDIQKNSELHHNLFSLLQKQSSSALLNTDSQEEIQSTNSLYSIPREKKERERLINLTKTYNLDKINQNELNKYINIKNKTPDGYYDINQPYNVIKKRIDEAFGPKTDFSISNFENNFDKMNKEEQGILTYKMQREFNKLGYTDFNGEELKEDGIFGNKTKSAYEQYKKSNNNDYTKTDKIITKVSSNTNKKSKNQTFTQWLSSGEENMAKAKAEKMSKRLNDPKIKEKADKVIKDNAEFIKTAATTHGVNPGILAACIYSEHRRNMEFNDYYLDSLAATFGEDTSLGISQVLMSTAKSMEELGYMPKITLNKNGKWGAPSIGYTYSSEVQARIKALEDPQTNIMYAAAYLKYIQDIWKTAYPEIDGRTAIMATLYNIGARGPQGPHSNPKSNEFGDFAKDNYYYVRELMGI